MKEVVKDSASKDGSKQESPRRRAPSVTPVLNVAPGEFVGTHNFALLTFVNSD